MNNTKRSFFTWILVLAFVVQGAVFDVRGAVNANEVGEMQQQMSTLEKVVKKFQKKFRQYWRCSKGKCSEKEKEQVSAELSRAGKVVGAAVVVVLVSLGGFVLGKKIKTWKAEAAADKAAEERQKAKAAKAKKQLIADQSKAIHGVVDKYSLKGETLLSETHLPHLKDLFVAALTKNDSEIKELLREKNRERPVIEALAHLYYGQAGKFSEFKKQLGLEENFELYGPK